MKQDYERIKKYFAQEIPAWLTVAWFSLLTVGLLMVLILANTRGLPRSVMTGVGLVCILIGASVGIVVTQIKIKDSEIDALLPPEEERFQADFRSHFTETNAAKLRYEQIYGSHSRDEEKFEPVYIGTYLFEGENVLHKNGSDGKSRSSLYSMSAFVLKKHCICVGERQISLISADAPAEDFFQSFDFADLSSAELVKTDKVGYSGKTKYRHLRLTDNEGRTAAEFPILADASADEYVDHINLRIRRTKETAENR